ncbi:DUF637 domain-containing protein [Cupriavidus plantarum]|uniref:DUF637 domain-containing protein n=1 Tax=Cupriavidus plantarum TaxID=942865 RepID=UPI0015CE0963
MGPAAVISGARDVTIQSGSVANNGALISGGRNVSVQASGGVDNTAIALNADWVGRWQEKRSGGDRWHDTGGRATIGNIASGIQAGNALSVNAGGQIVNTGNLLGANVDLTGASLVNGITSPNQPTPSGATPRQVISLGPAPVPAGSLPATTPTADPTQPWQFTPVIVAAPSAPVAGAVPTVDWHFNAQPTGSPITTPGGGAQYVSPNAATAVLAGVTPDSLLAQLPPELRPGNVSFYYDPYTESQQLQQAALAQTGQQTFINGLAWDSQNNLSVNDQQKLALYNNAAEYAKTNHITLGQALTDDQVKALDAPMLWYVEQAVPDPRCTAATSVCPSVNALVPQVYLPEGYAQALSVPTGGTISGDNIKIAVDGQLRNTGQIVASDTLAVKAQSIDLSPNVVSIGTNAYKAQGGWNVVTGTVVQPGGFLSAMHMDIEADSIRAINDAFRVTRADGSVDPDASAALVAQLKESLGLNYVEGTVADDIHTQFIKEKKGFGILGQIVAMAAAVAISIMTAGAGAALMGVALAEMSVMQAALAVAIDGLIAGTLSSMVTQVITTGSLNIGAALKAGAISGLTAGLTRGALGAMDLSNAGIGSIGDNLAKGNWTQAAGQLGNYAQASIVRSAISAGISTAVYGGSFGQSFAGGLIRDAAALAANAAGVKLPGIGAVDATTDSIIANAAAHALIGCAAQSLNGGDCAGGAIGGAASAIAAPLIRDTVYADSPVLNYSDDPVRQALTVGLATLIGGTTGLLLGGNATSAALAAQNESLNNATSTGPARGVANRENARLIKLCEPNCTQEDFNRIDTQVRQVEAAATLAKMNNLTPEQTLRLADTLSNLLPYYGSAAMLYQAVTGQTLSGQSLDTADRWLSGILGAIAVGAAAYGKISEFLTARGATATTGALNVEIASGKFDYLFGRVESGTHNAARSNQLALEMKRLGVPDTDAGRQMLTDHLARTINTEGNVSRTFSNQYGNFEVRDSLFIGPSGQAAKLESTFQVLADGSRRLSTIIPFQTGK